MPDTLERQIMIELHDDGTWCDDWAYSPRTYRVPPPDVRPRLIPWQELSQEDVCVEVRQHVRWNHARWLDQDYQRTDFFYRDRCEHHDSIHGGPCRYVSDDFRCDDDYCHRCWPRPADVRHGRCHMIYRSRAQREVGESPWRHRGNPCDEVHCDTCHPTWSLSLAELSRREAHDRRRRWEEHVSEQRYKRYTEIKRYAQERAQELLLSVLTTEQRVAYERRGKIPVTGSAGGRYLIERGYSGNVIIDDGERDTFYTRRRCAHPVMTERVQIDNLGEEWVPLPYEDAMVAQILRIQTDEPGFLEVANGY